MPRPCQRRREATTAHRKTKANPKPSGPPPIRHKARQKAIHNARHGRGRGGRPSRNQRSGNSSTNEQEQDFISFSNNGNNFHVLGGSGSQHNPISFADEDDDSLEDGELITDDGSEEDESDDLDMYDAQDMMINVQVDSVYESKRNVSRAEVMFPVMEAISIYRGLYRAGFPLYRGRLERYGVEEEVATLEVEPIQRSRAVGSTQQPIGGGVAQYSRIAFKSDSVAEPAPSRSLPANKRTGPAMSVQANADPTRDYVFDWGAHKGVPFTEVPESYLRTIGGNPYLLDNHPATKKAFDHHRPGMRRTVPTDAQRAAHERAQSTLTARTTRSSQGAVPKSWENFRFPSNSAHSNKRLNEVDENYLRTIEGMDHVMKKWPGLKEALQDYNEKTGRRGRGAR